MAGREELMKLCDRSSFIFIGVYVSGLSGSRVLPAGHYTSEFLGFLYSLGRLVAVLYINPIRFSYLSPVVNICVGWRRTGFLDSVCRAIHIFFETRYRVAN